MSEVWQRRTKNGSANSKQSLLPFFGTEPHEPALTIEKKGALDEISVPREKSDGGVGCEGRESVFDSERAVVLARGVKEAAEVSFIYSEHSSELVRRGRGLADREFFKDEPFFAEPFHGFAAGVALGVGVDFHERTWKRGDFRLPFSVKLIQKARD